MNSLLKAQLAEQLGVRIPVAKAAAMRYLLELVQRGFRYYTTGRVPVHKALALAQKFGTRYGTVRSKGARDYARKHGRAVARMVMYAEDPAAVQFWLLVTPGCGAVHDEERLQDAWCDRLTWSRHYGSDARQWHPQYELVHLQRAGYRGGVRHWTWRMSRRQYENLRIALVSSAARALSRGRSEAAELARFEALIDNVRRMPGFSGIREQKRMLFKAAAAAWTRNGGASRDWSNLGTWVDKRLRVF